MTGGSTGAERVSDVPARTVSLIVNPAAGGGRAGRLLGAVGNALRANGIEHHVERTRSLEHARELATAAAAAGEVAAAFGGDGLIGAVAGALARSGGVLGILPGGRGNDLARVLGIPPDPVAACQVIASGQIRRLDLGQAGERTFMGIASCGFDSDANRVANEARLVRGNLVYAYAALRTLARWKPAMFTLRLDGGAPRTIAGCTIAAANSKAYGGGMFLAPDASLEDGMLDVVTIEDRPKLELLRLLPLVFKGEHVNKPNVHVDARPGGRDRRRPPVHDVRRRRPDRRAPRDRQSRARRRPGDRPAMSLTLNAKLAAARAVGGITRRAGRGGTSLPGKVLIRLEPDAISELSSRLARGSVIVSATNGKTTTAAMVASILRRAGLSLVHNRAGANMAGGVASALLDAFRSRGMEGELGLFEVDEFWLDRIMPQLEPQAVLLGNLFRDQLDRYGELDTIADRWAAAVSRLAPGAGLVLNADDPMVADLGRGAENVTYFGVQDAAMAMPEMQHASDSKHCRRCGAAYSYDAIYLGHLGRYRCESCGQERPTPSVAADGIALDGTRRASFLLRTPAGDAQVELPLPGLYNVYNALGAAALCLELKVDLDTVVAGLGAVTAAFGRAETVTVGGAQLQVLLVKNPAGANEILRTLALEGSNLDVLVILNDRTADGRDISWIWDADFELLKVHVRRVTCAGTRAAELALRLKYAGVPEDRLDVRPELARALDDALAHTASGRLFVLPTYTALLELHSLLAARGHVPQFWEPAGSAAP